MSSPLVTPAPDLEAPAKAPLRRNRTMSGVSTKPSTPTPPTTSKPPKSVSFNLDNNTRHVYKERRRKNQTLRSQWYPLPDLQTLLEHELRIHKRSTVTTGQGVRPGRKHVNVHTCARGLEATLENRSTSDHCRRYVWKILGAQSRLRKAVVQMAQESGDHTATPAEEQWASQAEALRLFSREQTQADQQKAYQLGLQDASDVKLYRV